MKKISDVVANEVVKNTKFNTLKSNKLNKNKIIQTKVNNLEKKIPDATALTLIWVPNLCTKMLIILLISAFFAKTQRFLAKVVPLPKAIV